MKFADWMLLGTTAAALATVLVNAVMARAPYRALRHALETAALMNDTAVSTPAQEEWKEHCTRLTYVAVVRSERPSKLGRAVRLVLGVVIVCTGLALCIALIPEPTLTWPTKLLGGLYALAIAGSGVAVLDAPLGMQTARGYKDKVAIDRANEQRLNEKYDTAVANVSASSGLPKVYRRALRWFAWTNVSADKRLAVRRDHLEQRWRQKEPPQNRQRS